MLLPVKAADEAANQDADNQPSYFHKLGFLKYPSSHSETYKNRKLNVSII